MTRKDWIKYIIFRLTPHLLFDKWAYMRATPDPDLRARLRGRKMVYVFLGCDYANLGDYAITQAQARLLGQLYPDREVAVIAMNDTYRGLKTVVRYGHEDDIVTLIGGGNMGEYYYGYERKRNLVVQKLKHRKIVSFPQTVHFSDTPLGRLAERRSMKTYRAHRHLTLLLRERQSYDYLARRLPEAMLRLVPDVVMTLHERRARPRRGVVVSLRQDKEVILDAARRQAIVKALGDAYGTVVERDTRARSRDLSREFEDLLDTYASAECVVTDRLHGMILAYITDTPCVVFPNSNGKIVSSHEWLAACDTVRLLAPEAVGDLVAAVEAVRHAAVPDAAHHAGMVGRFVALGDEVF